MLAGYRTYISLAVAALSTFAQSLGIEVDVAGLDNAVVTIITIVLAAYYRRQATRGDPK